MQEFYVIVKYETSWEDFFWTPHILCEDGHFEKPHDIMSSSLYTPIFFSSKESAKQAKKVYGHWPKYRILKIQDPSWLN